MRSIVLLALLFAGAANADWIPPSQENQQANCAMQITPQICANIFGLSPWPDNIPYGLTAIEVTTPTPGLSTGPLGDTLPAIKIAGLFHIMRALDCWVEENHYTWDPNSTLLQPECTAQEGALYKTTIIAIGPSLNPVPFEVAVYVTEINEAWRKIYSEQGIIP